MNLFRVPTTASGYRRAFWQHARGIIRPHPPGVDDQRITPEFGDLEVCDIRTDSIVTAVCLGQSRLMLNRPIGDGIS